MILDMLGHTISVLTGWARGTFKDVLLEAASEFKRQSFNTPPVQHGKPPRRESFHAMVTGILYGGGQPVSFELGEGIAAV